MTPQPRLVSDAELEILKVLWDRGPGTVRDVLRNLRRAGREWAYTTAQTLLLRLREKGFVASTKEGRAFVFRPTVSRDDLLGQSLEALADRVCDGAALPLLLRLVQSARFTPADIRRFRGLLDELEEGGA
ncbi:MAG: BlaI/MecI/CopY family transcriptional regulator [Planctomycetota bacterium]